MHPPIRLVAIDMDGTLLPTLEQKVSRRNVRALRAAQEAGITVAIATGRRAAYTAPLLEGLGLRADMPLIASNGAVTCTLGGQPIDRCLMKSSVARGLCGLLRPFGAVVFTFDRPGRGELVLEDLNQAHGRIAMWIEANRNAIEVVKPLELALANGDDPIQGMAAGSIAKMRDADTALKASEWASQCGSARTEYPARDLSILDLLPPGVSKGSALERLAARLGVDRKETMAIGDNWNDVHMLEWAGQGIVMANAAQELRSLAKTRGWKQAPSNDDDGVAVVLEAALARLAAAELDERILRRMKMRGAHLLIFSSAAAIAGWALPVHAAEQAMLANGFALRCDHHASVAGKVRLYLSAGEDSYIEFAPAEIAGFEFVPDPPTTAARASAPTANVPVKLTETDLHEMLTRAGTEHNIDVDLLASVVKAESDGDTRAVSRAGAQGLMQLMPGTAANLGVRDSFQPEQNVRGGSTYLDYLLTLYHDNLAKALAAYNAGPAAVDKYHGIPPYRETRIYVARVIHEFNRRVLAREAQARHATAPQAAQK